MKRLSFLLMLLTMVAISFACSEPDTPGGGSGSTDQPDNPVNPDDPEKKTFKLGDYYKEGLAEGIVAYLEEDGEHGLLISIDEGIAQWSTTHDMLTDMGGEFSMEDGAWNCVYIRSLEDWENKYPAFAWCHAKNVLGLNAWFLPAIDECAKIMPAIEAINTTLTEMGETPIALGVNDSYWTSVEVGAQSAYAYSFAEGDIASYDLDKLNEHRVRAMRKF